MKFLDRESELARLNAAVERQAAGLVAVWGRRRVGKTRLLTEWCLRNGGVYSVADQSAETVQRRYFAEAVSSRLAGFKDVEYPDWRVLLSRLSNDARAEKWRGPLVLDEFPYLVASSPAMPSVLQNWIDGEASTGGLLVAIAGSSQRMMQGMLLDAAAPLYGRALEAMELHPLPAGLIGSALGLTDAVAMVRAYAQWGGIPRYWELAEPFGPDLDRSVDQLVLDPLGPLHREPDRLLLEEMPPAVGLRPLLDVIGAGAHRLSEVAGRLGQPATSLARPLGRLVELGYVRREVPYGEPEKTSRRALYRIADPFFRLWFAVVAPYRAALAAATDEIRQATWARRREGLFAEAWEGLCRSAAPRLAWEESGTSAGWLPAGRWWRGNAAEWDLVTSSADRSVGLVGEVKWSARAFEDGELESLARETLSRPLPPDLPRNVFRAVFVPRSVSGMAVTASGVRVVEAETVMNVLR